MMRSLGLLFAALSLVPSLAAMDRPAAPAAAAAGATLTGLPDALGEHIGACLTPAEVRNMALTCRAFRAHPPTGMLRGARLAEGRILDIDLSKEDWRTGDHRGFLNARLVNGRGALPERFLEGLTAGNWQDLVNVHVDASCKSMGMADIATLLRLPRLLDLRIECNVPLPGAAGGAAAAPAARAVPAAGTVALPANRLTSLWVGQKGPDCDFRGLDLGALLASCPLTSLQVHSDDWVAWPEKFGPQADLLAHLPLLTESLTELILRSPGAGRDVLGRLAGVLPRLMELQGLHLYGGWEATVGDGAGVDALKAALAAMPRLEEVALPGFGDLDPLAKCRLYAALPGTLRVLHCTTAPGVLDPAQGWTEASARAFVDSLGHLENLQELTENSAVHPVHGVAIARALAERPGLRQVRLWFCDPPAGLVDQIKGIYAGAKKICIAHGSNLH